MKHQTISFRPIGESGPLSVYWYDGPYGDATEAEQGNGVGWFSQRGDLLGVEFDDVHQSTDHQSLLFTNGVEVEVNIIKGKVTVNNYTKQIFKQIKNRKVNTAAF